METEWAVLYPRRLGRRNSALWADVVLRSYSGQRFFQFNTISCNFKANLDFGRMFSQKPLGLLLCFPPSRSSICHVLYATVRPLPHPLLTLRGLHSAPLSPPPHPFILNANLISPPFSPLISSFTKCISFSPRRTCSAINCSASRCCRLPSPHVLRELTTLRWIYAGSKGELEQGKGREKRKRGEDTYCWASLE